MVELTLTMVGAYISDDNFNQYYKVLHTLQKNPNSRQGTMIYTRPSMHEDSCEDGMKDFMCTNAVTYFIRECPISKVDQIHCVVQMRSNDAVYGYKMTMLGKSMY